MPDQDKKLYDHLSGPQERYLNMYGPHSPANSDSPLSLVVRKEDHRKLGVVDSPGRSSGFSEGSYESSPNRSPQNYPSQPRDEEEKPLSLVIRKNNQEEAEAVEEREERGYWGRQTDQDSGNDDSEPPLVISEDDKDQDVIHDFSTAKHEEKLEVAKPREEQQAGSPGSGIKIKSFAKLFDSPGGHQGGSADQSGPPAVAEDSSQDRISEEPELVSDSASCCSNDSMMEGKPFIYGTELEMRRVSKSSSGETLYQCDFCDKLFANKYHLQSHLVTHTGERAFTCKVCQKTFGRKSTLRAHMTTHTKVSNFMCGVCEKACNDNNSLEEHMRMHTGEKPFVCTICQKAYARKSHLNVHYRVHTGERPFVCEYCNKDFTEKRFLNDHLQTAHNGVDGPLKCPNCSREFAYKTSLKQHLKKQMCERNIKRSHGNLSNGAVAKQFQCPFCDKSYSWKQTLKQHVSMYHRNKVHTDEFWRYELTKNRRTIMDDKANEDLWKAQLGKHAEETARQKREAEQAARALAALEAGAGEGGNNNQQDQSLGEKKWLEQIKRNNNNPADQVQPSTEMKLMALQSLQNSLRFMSMGMSSPGMSNLQIQNLSNIQDQVIKVEPPASSLPPQESYLNLLAQIAKRESEERENNNSNDSIVANDHNDTGDGVENRKETSSNADNVNNTDSIPVLPTKEESSVKRTQLWLQQVNKYRHRLPKEELDANHEELWEQQISRVKNNPVRSPLEPEEIIIEDELEAPAVRSPVPVPRISRANTLNLNNNNNSNNNNNNNNNNNSNNNNNGEGVAIFPAQIILSPGSGAGSPGTATLTLSQQFLSGPGGSPQLKVFLHQPPLQDIRRSGERQSTDTETSRPSRPLTRDSSPSAQADHANTEDSSSMLKSLLLDRMKRKRSSSIDTEANSKKSSTMSTGESSKSSKPISIPEAPNDILRKRLLGWVDPPAPPTPKETPREDKKAADKKLDRSQQENCRKQEGNVFQLDLDTSDEDNKNNKKEKEEEEEEEDAGNTKDKREKSSAPAASDGGSGEERQEPPKNVLTYANTSVLKHLLHRYTETKQ